MKILVTGSAGFIGYHLTKYLIKKQKNIIGIDNLNNYYSIKLKKKRLDELNKVCKKHNFIKFKFHKIDIANFNKLNLLFKKYKFDYVINLAAQAGVRYSLTNPSAYVRSNLVGFSNIIDLCKTYKIKHLIYASTSSVYGSNISLPFKESDPADHPIQFYAATKRSNELIAHSYSSMFSLPTTGLRFFTVNGPFGRPDMAYYKFSEKIYNNQTVDVYNYGNHSRSFTDVDDVVKCIYKLIKKIPKRNKNKLLNLNPHTSVAPFRILNIGSNKKVNIIDYVNTIGKLLNKKIKIKFIRKQLGDVENTSSDPANLKKIIDINFQTSISKTIQKFINWFLKYKQKN